MKVKEEGANRKAHDLQNGVKINANLDTYFETFMDMANKLESMWDDLLRRVPLAKHPI